MTKFEERGVSKQYNSKNTREAKRAFDYSCDKCSKAGMHIICDRCAISCAHKLILDYLNN